MPDPTSNVGIAANSAILFMVVIVFCMFGLMLKIMYNFARKARQFENSSQNQI